SVFFGPSSSLSFSNKIGVVHINGVIKDSEPIIRELTEFKKDKGIKAIILRIDSPGGGVGASQEIYREVQKTTKIKKVIISLGGIAASGGYYIASAGDMIIANPGTITGSIGVIMEFIQIQELFKKIGVGLEVLKSGEYKDIGSPHRKLTDRDKELIKGLISDIQEQFIEAVASGRKISVEKVREIADGRILSGATAKELGLVDRLGNFQDAVDLAKKLSGVKGDVNLVFPKKTRKRIWDLFFQNITRAFYEAIINSFKTTVEYRWSGLSYLRD
ncbi:signal peptide peptidase SppA, partial [Thermodesulfobacteriota bacterium]